MAHGTQQAIGSVTGKNTSKAGVSTWAQLEESYPIKAKLISYGSTESIKALNKKLHWGRARNCVSA